MKHREVDSGRTAQGFNRLAFFGVLCCLLPAFPAAAVTRYVAASGSAPSHPYTSWATAASDIQTAVNACSPGDVVTVSNGIYTVDSGTEVVLITNGIHLQSANGLTHTVIDGGNVAGIIRRGVHLTAAASGAVVKGFTIRRGRADGNLGAGVRIEAGTIHSCVISNNSALSNGGGAGVYVAGGIVSNCVITHNGAHVAGGGVRIDSGTVRHSTIRNNTSGVNGSFGGGGVYLNGASAVLEYCVIHDNRGGASAHGGGIHQVNGTAQNCLIWRNSVAHSAGVYLQNGTLSNCTIVQNRNTGAPNGAGLRQTGGTAQNLMIWDNFPGANFTRDKDQCPDVVKTGGTFTYSCSIPLQPGAGNIALEPAFIDPANGNFRLAPGSAGIDAGTNLPAITLDIEGTTRPLNGDDTAGAFHDMGCYESQAINSGPFRCGFSLSTNEGITSLQVVLRPRPAGTVSNIAWYGWDINNNGTWDHTGTGSGIVTQTFGIGFHTITLRLTNTADAAASCTRTEIVRVAAPIAHVRPSGGTPTPPYSNWDTAATNLTDALRYVSGGSTVRVTNGTYSITSQVEVVKGITLESMNGYDHTLIRRSAGNTRIMLVAAANARVDGFRMENGYITSADLGAIGAGLYLAAGTVTACNITTNWATSNATGGGAYVTGGSLERSRITRNRGHMNGGGLYLTGGIVERCILADNKAGLNAGYHGGGAYQSGGILRNCLIYDNQGGTGGNAGGVHLNNGMIDHCTIAYNLSGTGGGGGIFRAGGTVTNSIVYYNLKTATPDNYNGNLSFISYSCGPDLTSGTGNITSEPLFVDGAARDFHLQSTSPCIDAGADKPGVTDDFEGNLRPQDGNASGGAQYDMGAYERPDASSGPFAVDFSVTPNKGLESVAAVFRVMALGSETNLTWYGWDFDNNGSWDRSGPDLGIITNTFGPGIHTVSLRVTNLNHESASQVKASAVQVSPYVIHVANGGGNTPPYTNWAMACTNIFDAYDLAVNGTTIILSNGTYRLTQTLSIDKDVTIQGAYGPSNTLLTRANTGAELRLVSLNAPGARLEAVTLTNGYGTLVGPGAIIDQGIMRNCIIRNCVIPGNSSGAIYMTGGLMDDCLIITNRVNLNGGGIYMTGGLVLNSRIAWNKAGGNAGYGGGGIYMTGGNVRNCLVIGNVGGTSAGGGGVLMTGGLLESSTVTGNVGGSTGGGGVYRTGGAITNSLIYSNRVGVTANDAGGAVSAYWYSCAPELDNPGNGNITDNPQVKTWGTGFGLTHVPGDYTLTPDSPCYNKGIIKPWMFTTPDLAGDRRISGGIPDMGAYEYQLPGGSVFLIR